MTDHKSLYIHSAAEAKEYRELEQWRESHKENCKCARAIENAISRSFDGHTLQGGCAREIIDQFGFNRVNFVLSNTLREKSHDGRFSNSNKDWSQGIYVPKNDSNWAFTVESHPAVLDGFINLTRQAFRELKLYDSSHCLDTHGEPADYTEKVLVIRPDWLKDAYKQPEYQLFYAECGFGCSPKASGRKVFGQFLYDGEKTHLDRSDFVGIIRQDHLPQWAKEKLDAIQKPVQEQTM